MLLARPVRRVGLRLEGAIGASAGAASSRSAAAAPRRATSAKTVRVDAAWLVQPLSASCIPRQRRPRRRLAGQAGVAVTHAAGTPTPAPRAAHRRSRRRVAAEATQRRAHRSDGARAAALETRRARQFGRRQGGAWRRRSREARARREAEERGGEERHLEPDPRARSARVLEPPVPWLPLAPRAGQRAEPSPCMAVSSTSACTSASHSPKPRRLPPAVPASSSPRSSDSARTPGA